MSKRTPILNSFPRHVVPDELSLLSRYEIILYFLIFCICFNLFQKWTSVPINIQEVQVERLDSLWISGDKSASYANIQYELPISSVFRKKTPSINVSVFPLEASARRADNRYVLDSLRGIYFEHYPLEIENFTGRLYYQKASLLSSKNGKLSGDYSRDNIQRDNYYNRSFYQYSYAWISEDKPYRVNNEVFMNGPEDVRLSSNIEHASLMTPRFFSKYDVSQAYYKLIVHSYSLDSISVRLKFSGAVDVAPMGVYAPDEITGDGVHYSLLPREDKSDGFLHITLSTNPDYERDQQKETINEEGAEILFHVKYRDLENVQSRRVFLVTAIMSGLLTIFIAFLIIYVYRVARFLIGSKKKKEVDEGPTDDTVM